MLNTPSIKTDLQQTWKDLLETFTAFPKELVNTVPFEGSWTAAQVVDHLLKSNGGVFIVIQGKTQPADRPTDKNIPEIKKTFLDFDLKMTSPKEVEPVEEPLEKEKLLTALKTLSVSLEKAVETYDLEEICIDAGFPFTGFLTRLEWLYFSIYHTQRHTHQLKNIGKVLGI